MNGDGLIYSFETLGGLKVSARKAHKEVGIRN